MQRALGGVPRRVLRDTLQTSSSGVNAKAARAAVAGATKAPPRPGERPRDRYGSRLGENAMRFMEDALCLDSAERLDWRRALAHPYFDGMDGWVPAVLETKPGAAARPDAERSRRGTRKGNPFRLREVRRVRRRRGGSRERDPRRSRAGKSLAEARRRRIARTARARRKREEAAEAEAEAAERRPRGAREGKRRARGAPGGGGARALPRAIGWSATRGRRARSAAWNARRRFPSLLLLALLARARRRFSAAGTERDRERVVRGERVQASRRAVRARRRLVARATRVASPPDDALGLGSRDGSSRNCNTRCRRRDTGRASPASAGSAVPAFDVGANASAASRRPDSGTRLRRDISAATRKTDGALAARRGRTFSTNPQSRRTAAGEPRRARLAASDAPRLRVFGSVR